MKVSLNKRLKQYPLPKIVLLLFLLLLVGFGAAPWYFKGNWPPDAPSIETQTSLRRLLKQGLALPGWQTQQKEIVLIGGQKWSLQTILPQGPGQNRELQDNDAAPLEKSVAEEIILLLRPQKDEKDQPAVEWTDISGQQQWKTDSHRLRQLMVQSPKDGKLTKVKVHFFRSWKATPTYSQWTRSQTFAVVQWYAWPRGGSPNPLRWFLADQVAQWHKHRLPWVAVNIMIPAEPLTENLDPYWQQAESVGKAVQEALMKAPLNL